MSDPTTSEKNTNSTTDEGSESRVGGLTLIKRRSGDATINGDGTVTHDGVQYPIPEKVFT